jgi:hypothetical protein
LRQARAKVLGVAFNKAPVTRRPYNFRPAIETLSDIKTADANETSTSVYEGLFGDPLPQSKTASRVVYRNGDGDKKLALPKPKGESNGAPRKEVVIDVVEKPGK